MLITPPNHATFRRAFLAKSLPAVCSSRPILSRFAPPVLDEMVAALPDSQEAREKRGMPDQYRRKPANLPFRRFYSSARARGMVTEIMPLPFVLQKGLELS